VRTTEAPRNRRRSVAPVALRATGLGVLLGLLLLAATGCSGAGAGTTGVSVTPTTTPLVGAHMAGAVSTVTITQEALASRPAPWNLSTPESAIRSYLAWTSYAYRIAESSVAAPTMGANEAVRVDSYIQLNLEKLKLIDQELTSITFGRSSVDGTHTLVPTKEAWAYRYVSSTTAGKVVGAPFTASYDATYTVVRAGKYWVVYSVVAKAQGPVK
jgi:hypothetical protein